MQGLVKVINGMGSIEPRFVHKSENDVKNGWLDYFLKEFGVGMGCAALIYASSALECGGSVLRWIVTTIVNVVTS